VSNIIFLRDIAKSLERTAARIRGIAPGFTRAEQDRLVKCARMLHATANQVRNQLNDIESVGWEHDYQE
jgi:hypothetical protein